MVIRKTNDFLGQFAKLSRDIQKIYKNQESIFIKNWLDPRLHAKRLKDIRGVYSFRITRRYRVLFYFSEGDAIFFKIGHRKDVYS